MKSIFKALDGGHLDQSLFKPKDGEAEPADATKRPRTRWGLSRAKDRPAGKRAKRSRTANPDDA